jgi:(2Fe-2S) ferredoxin
MHVIICINEKEKKNSCSPTISINDYLEIKKWAKENKLIPEIFITKSSCIGFCNPVGGVIAIFPQMKYYFEIEDLESIKKIIIEEYNNIKNN